MHYLEGKRTTIDRSASTEEYRRTGLLRNARLWTQVDALALARVVSQSRKQCKVKARKKRTTT